MRWCDTTTYSLPNSTQRKVKPTASKSSRLLRKSIHVAKSSAPSTQPDPSTSGSLKAEYGRTHIDVPSLKHRCLPNLFVNQIEAGISMEDDACEVCFTPPSSQHRPLECINDARIILGISAAGTRYRNISMKQAPVQPNAFRFDVA